MAPAPLAHQSTHPDLFPLSLTHRGRYQVLLSFPPWRGKVWMGGSRLVLTPTLALPHRGGGERLAAFPGEIPTPVSPAKGEGMRWVPKRP